MKAACLVTYGENRFFFSVCPCNERQQVFIIVSGVVMISKIADRWVLVRTWYSTQELPFIRLGMCPHRSRSR